MDSCHTVNHATDRDKPRRPRTPDLDGLARVTDALEAWMAAEDREGRDIPAEATVACQMLNAWWLEQFRPAPTSLIVALGEFARPTLLERRPA